LILEKAVYTAAALLYPDALATSVTLPMEILQAASQLASVGRRGEPQMRFLLAGPNRRLMRLASGLQLKPDLPWDSLPTLDLLLLPAIWRNPLPTLRHSESLLELLRERHARGTKICSVGTGSYLLAEAGLLDGRPATTHWHYFERFQQRYPAVTLKSRHLITQSGSIYCVGSVNSIADLMVHLVEEWFGSRVARAVENQFSPEIRQPFREAAWQDEPRTAHHDELVLEAQQWLQDHFSEKVQIDALARRLGLSTRTLNRRFKLATGMTPLGYLRTLRMTEARELLRHSNLGIGEIGWQVGLPDGGYFARQFRAHSGMTPLQYREAVRGKLFAAPDN
jgi:transcriptional regulator GlxA family with amidase domain